MAVWRAWEAASHWSVCFPNCKMEAARARVSISILFSITKASCTPSLTEFTKRSETRLASWIESFLAFSKLRKKLKQP